MIIKILSILGFMIFNAYFVTASDSDNESDNEFDTIITFHKALPLVEEIRLTRNSKIVDSSEFPYYSISDDRSKKSVDSDDVKNKSSKLNYPESSSDDTSSDAVSDSSQDEYCGLKNLLCQKAPCFSSYFGCLFSCLKTKKKGLLNGEMG
ncbi:MAG: hypothetical protein Q8S21_06235 [Candidatus Paracaedibacteraceae bacterium]|nr:hypothetical protein [Candidatus Paracaedibacteraceae bacterium]